MDTVHLNQEHLYHFIWPTKWTRSNRITKRRKNIVLFFNYKVKRNFTSCLQYSSDTQYINVAMQSHKVCGGDSVHDNVMQACYIKYRKIHLQVQLLYSVRIACFGNRLEYSKVWHSENQWKSFSKLILSNFSVRTLQYFKKEKLNFWPLKT